MNAVRYRFAEFAVVRDVDAELVLTPHHISDRGAQLRMKMCLIHRLGCGAGTIRID
jgi:hypothetical protein